jgi:hypothetical protein
MVCRAVVDISAGQLVSLRCLKGCLVLENVAADGSVTVTHAVHLRRRPTGGGPLRLSVEEVRGIQ